MHCEHLLPPGSKCFTAFLDCVKFDVSKIMLNLFLTLFAMSALIDSGDPRLGAVPNPKQIETMYLNFIAHVIASSLI